MSIYIAPKITAVFPAVALSLMTLMGQPASWLQAADEPPRAVPDSRVEATGKLCLDNVYTSDCTPAILNSGMSYLDSVAMLDVSASAVFRSSIPSQDVLPNTRALFYKAVMALGLSYAIGIA